MKAFLLAAGLGARLKPLTEKMPKCMVPIDGQPLLDIWLDALAGAGVDEVLINLHHLPGIVRHHVQARTDPPQVRMVFEPELLGSAGTLVANREWVEGEDMFLVCNADNLTDFDLQSLIYVHIHGQAFATLTLFHAERPSECGIVEVNGEGRVVGYVEKPARSANDLANAGIYAFSPAVADEIPRPPPKDIGYDLLPRLVGRAQAITMPGYFRDIGTPEAYRRAQFEWCARKQR